MLLQCEYKHAAKLPQHVCITNKCCCSYLLWADTSSSSSLFEQISPSGAVQCSDTDTPTTGYTAQAHAFVLLPSAFQSPWMKGTFWQLSMQDVQNSEHWPFKKVREEHWYKYIKTKREMKKGGEIKCHLMHLNCSILNANVITWKAELFLIFLYKILEKTMNTVLPYQSLKL